MKISTLLLAIIVSSISIYGQDQDAENRELKTKMEVFASKTGIITKFTDSNLEGIKTSLGTNAETRIRKVNSGSIETFFFQVVKAGKYGNSTASIAYSDLLESIKAIEILRDQEGSDIVANPDYLENKFITEDGFQVGYFVRKGKSTWYLRLEKYGSDNTIFVKDSEAILTSFIQAKNKIDELKSN